MVPPPKHFDSFHKLRCILSYIGPRAKRKREGEHVTIIVAGCVAQQEGAVLLRRALYVYFIMGPQYANRIVDLLEDVAKKMSILIYAYHVSFSSIPKRRRL